MKTLYLKLLAIIVMASSFTIANSQNIEIANTSNKDNIYDKLIETLGYQKVLKTNNSIIITINSDQIFEPNSSELKQTISSELNNTIDILKKFKRYQFSVLIHTSAEGANDINLSISQKRADVLCKYLAKNNLKLKRFKCIGMGESESEVYSTNRIEIKIPYIGM